MKKRKQGIIYGRKSRENAATLESQINACIQWCEANNIEYEIYAEEGSSSSEDWNRPKLQEMITKIENLEFDFVIVTEQTRISRTEDFSMFKKLLRETNTILVLADTNESINYNNPNDSVKSGIQQVFGEYELSTAKIRLKRGTVQSAKKGNWVGKKVPLGYEYDKTTKRLKLSEHAPVIRKIFELYMEGLSTTDISFKLTHEKIFPTYIEKGEEKEYSWTGVSIGRMLKNIVYRGHTLYGKTTDKKVKGKRKTFKTDPDKHILIENTHEPIVTQDEWDQVQEIIKKRNSRPPSLKIAKHTFSGLIVCRECGSIHSFQKAKGRQRITSCQNRVYNDDFTKYEVCKNSGAFLDDFEALFYSFLSTKVLELESRKDMIIKYQESLDQSKQSNNLQKVAQQKQIQHLKKKVKKIQNLIEEDFYDDFEEEKEKILEVKQLKNQIKTLEQELEITTIKKEETIIEHFERILNNMKNFLQGKQNPNMDEKEANEILSTFIDKIIYKKNGKKIEIDCKLKKEIREVIQELDSLKIKSA